MEIIPVIDLKGGIVVHAKAGHRDQYLPLQSLITSSIQLTEVIADLLTFFPFKTIYIADLDCISGVGIDWAYYHTIVSQFPSVSFWLDAGVRGADEIAQIAQLDLLPVVGSESLTTLTDLQDNDQFILSLDFKAGRFLGLAALWERVDLWPEQVIAMNLDYVGTAQGPDYALIRQLRLKNPNASIIAAGGVRSVSDIHSLVNEHVSQILVASALHNGRLRLNDLQTLLSC